MVNIKLTNKEAEKVASVLSWHMYEYNYDDLGIVKDTKEKRIYMNVLLKIAKEYEKKEGKHEKNI